MDRARRGRRRRPLRPQRRFARAGARPLPRGARRRAARRPPAADRRRPGRGPGRPVPQPAFHRISARARLLALSGTRPRAGRSVRRRRRRGAALRRRGRGLRAGARRGHQPVEPGDRGPRLLGRTGRRGAPGAGVRGGAALARDPAGRKAFPGARRHLGRLPRGAPRRADRTPDSLPPRAAPVPPGGARRAPGAHDGARGISGARPFASGDPLPEYPGRHASRHAAVPGDGLLGRPRDEGDLRTPRRGRRGRRGAGRRVRRAAAVPGRGGSGGGDRADRPAGARRRYVPSGGVGVGEALGTSSGVGGGAGTLSAEPAGGGGGTTSTAGGAAAGALGKCCANIAGR
jgi:hypothetical protein